MFPRVCIVISLHVTCLIFVYIYRDGLALGEDKRLLDGDNSEVIQ